MKQLSLCIAALGLVIGACSSTTTTSPTTTPSLTGPTVSTVTEKDFAIALGSSTAASGKISFAVRNDGPGVHEFVIFASDLAEDGLPMKADGTGVNEEGTGVKHIDEIEDIAAGQTKTLEVDLPAGRYVLVCNIEGHYKQGMHAVLTVS